MNASNYQPNRLPILVMNTFSDFFTDPSAPDFDRVYKQGLLRPFDTETAGVILEDGTFPGGLTQTAAREEDYTGNQASDAAAPWLRAYPDPEGFGVSACDAACWDRQTGVWYVVASQSVSDTLIVSRLFKCGEWLDTEAYEIGVLGFNANEEIVKDIHPVQVTNSSGVLRTVLVLRLGRRTFPASMADWYGRLCWMEATGGPLKEFQRISYPRDTSSASPIVRDLLWSMCVGGNGYNRIQQGGTLPPEKIFGLIDRTTIASDQVTQRQQGISSWSWSAGSQTFQGGSFGGTLLGSANSEVDDTRFNDGTYWKRISWNPYLQNGGGAVMFPALNIAHPEGRGGGSAVTTLSRIVYPAGFDNRAIGELYKLPVGPEILVDADSDVVRSTLHPAQCWVDLDAKSLYVVMSGGWGGRLVDGGPREGFAEARKQLGVFAYSPPAALVPGASEAIHRQSRQQVSGATFSAASVPYTYPARVILGPGCY